jgi:hypothetical protein
MTCHSPGRSRQTAAGQGTHLITLEFVRTMRKKALYRALESAELPNDKARDIHVFYSG